MESREISSEAQADPDWTEVEIDLYGELSVFLALSPEEQRLYMEEVETATPAVTKELVADHLAGNVELPPIQAAEEPSAPEPSEAAQVADNNFWFMTDPLVQTSDEPIGVELEASAQPAPETAGFVTSPLDLFYEESAEQAAEDTVLETSDESPVLPASQPPIDSGEVSSLEATQASTPLDEADDSLLDEFLQTAESPFNAEGIPPQPVEAAGEHEWDLDFDSLASSEVSEVKEELPAAQVDEPVEPVPDSTVGGELWGAGELLPALRPSSIAQATTRCAVCGSQADSADLFCVECGAFFDEPQPEPAGALTCEDCGAAVTADELFCPSCGSVVSVG